jgi:hypothetical protein
MDLCPPGNPRSSSTGPPRARRATGIAARLQAKQAVDLGLWRRHTAYLKEFLHRTNYAGEAARLGIAGRLAAAELELARVSSPAYLDTLQGTIGAEPAIAAAG